MAGLLDGAPSQVSLPWPNNSIVDPSGPITTNASPGVGSLRMGPYYVPNPVRLTGVSVETTVASDVGGLFRVGIWAVNPATGLPTGVPLNGAASTCAADAIGFATAAVALVLNPGWYWAGACLENTAGQPTVRVQSSSVVSMPTSANSANNAGYVVAGVTAGTLPTLTGAILGSAVTYRLLFVTGTL